MEIKKFIDSNVTEKKKKDHKLESLEYIINMSNRSINNIYSGLQGSISNEINAIKLYTISLEKRLMDMINDIIITTTEMVKYHNKV